MLENKNNKSSLSTGTNRELAELTLFYRDTRFHIAVWAKNIMPGETGFINQTDYSMSQALAQTRKNNGFEP